MSHRHVLTAGSAEALEEALGSFGATAPPRCARRGQQKKLDRFVLNRFLRHGRSELAFPIDVFEGETPDFYLRSGRSLYPIEITEGSDPAEQAEWTRFEKSGDKTRDIGLEDPNRPLKFAALMEQAIRRKSQKPYPQGTLLVIYVQTDAVRSETAEWCAAAWRDHASGGMSLGPIGAVAAVRERDLIWLRGATPWS